MMTDTVCPGVHSQPRVSSEIEAYIQRTRQNSAYAEGLARGESCNGGVPKDAIAQHRLLCKQFLAGLEART